MKNEVKIQTKISDVDRLNKEIGPCLEFAMKPLSQDGEQGAMGVHFSDKTELSHDTLPKFDQAMKNVTGICERPYSAVMLNHVSNGFYGDECERLNAASSLIPSFRPQDPYEATLIAQYLALQAAGTKYLRRADAQDRFEIKEKLLALANKLLNTANQTVLTLLKYRSGGQQAVQVIHMHNEGQAIVTQNLSQKKEGDVQNNESNPMDH